jgi:hypothetical protein
MNKIIVLALLFVFSTCRLKMEDCTANDGPSLYIDTTSGDYKYNWDFDWTDEDSFPFKVPFTSSFGENDIIPFFINASTVSPYGSREYNYLSQEDADKQKKTPFKDLSDEKIYNTYQVFYPFDYYEIEIDEKNRTLLKHTIKGEEFKANKNDVNQKFIKYFGWAVCSGNKRVSVTVSNILVTFNNGNYFSISKILLATLALLFL